MEIKRDILCRDKGLVFQKLVVEGAVEGVGLQATAATKEADAVPCDVYPLGLGEFVLCAPDFSVDQQIDLRIVGQDGVDLGGSSITISGWRSKWESKFNYLFAKEKAYEIRNINQRFFDRKADIQLLECCVAKVRRVLRGRVVLPADDVTAVVVKLLDEKGRIFSEPRRFDVYEDDRYMDCDANPYRAFPFFVEVPGEVRNYCVVVDVPERPDLNNFCGFPVNMHKKLVGDFMDRSLDANENPDYCKWFERFRVDGREVSRQRQIEFPLEPKFSIIVPLYNTPIGLFRDMVDSVLSQTYSSWELILVNSTPENAELTHLVDECANGNDRVHVVTLDGNYGITENTNRGVAVAVGDYVAFFDHDDVLEPDILFEYAKAVNEDPSIDMLYCDEDKLLDSGLLAYPNFKPDFSIDQLRNNNYVCHMLTVRKSLLDRIGPTPEGFDGAQDHWLALRVSEETKNIKHVPKVLYHWRATAGSTALSNANKTYATDAGIRAVRSHIERLGIDADVEGYGRQFTYRVKYNAPAGAKVSIVIPSHNGEKVLRKCLDSIFEKTDYANYEVVLVENNSTEKALFDYYEELEGSGKPVKVVTWEGEGFNFSSLVNFGVSKCDGEYILLLNNDIEVLDRDWLDILAGFVSRPEVGAVGPRLWYPDDTYQHAGLAVVGNGVARLFVDLPEEHAPTKYLTFHDMTRNVSAVTGACLMTRREVFDEVGGFDKGLSVAFNDVDYCLKCAERGYLTVYTADTSLYHYESFTRGTDYDKSENQVRMNKELAAFRQRWAEIYVKGDPYYNRNLVQEEPEACYFGLAKY